MIWFLFRLAIRNMFRNKRRTVLTFFAIISGMASLIVFGGFVSYTYWGLREVTIHPQLGHIQIYHEGYSNEGMVNPYQNLLCDFPKLESEVRSLPEVRAVTARLEFGGLISNGDYTLSCLATGIIPEREEALMRFETLSEGERKAMGFETLIAGSHLTSSQNPGAVLGKELSRALNAKVGDFLTLLTTTTTGMINAMDVEVVGIVSTSAKEYDRVFVRVPLSVAQTLLNTDCVQKAIVLLDRTENTDVVAEALRDRFKSKGMPLELKTWYDLADFYRAVVRMYDGMFGVVKVIIVVLFLFGIANTMTMSVFERVREIGTLRAIGTKKSGIVKLFLYEGFLLGLVGGILGVIVGLITAKLINFFGGFYMPPPPGMSQGYQAFIFIEPQILLYAFVSTLVVSTLSSLYPAWKATSLKIVEALGHT